MNVHELKTGSVENKVQLKTAYIIEHILPTITEQATVIQVLYKHPILELLSRFTHVSLLALPLIACITGVTPFQ